MKILIVSATEFEIKSIRKEFVFFKKINENLKSYFYKKTKIDILVTEIGITFTTYHLTKTLILNKYNFVINVGICGSFNKKIKIGEFVNIISDEFADLGIYTKNDFKTLFDFKFMAENKFPFTKGILINKLNNNLLEGVKKVKGITVNSVSGNKNQINFRINKFNSDVETMEGAAFFYVCLNEKLPFLQLRTISNYVEERNKENWNIPLAINILYKEILSFLNKIILKQ